MLVRNFSNYIIKCMLKHLNINLYGKVQGVFLRRTVEHEAERRGIFGFVRNASDGTVYIEAEADEKKIDEFVSWLKGGAGGGGDYHISEVDASEGTFKAYSEFEIQ